MADTNYGTLVSIAGVAGLKVINVPAPELAMGSIDATNHSSGGWRQYIADNLRGASAFDITVEATAAVIAAVAAVWTAAVPVAIVFTEYLHPAWSFNGLLTKFKFGDAGATKPDLATAVISIQPTGTVSLAAAGATWFASVAYLYADCGGYYTMAHPNTKQLTIYAVIPGLPPFAVSPAQCADLTFASSVVGKATVSAAGLITTVAAGDTVVSIRITTVAAVETVVNVTVT